MTICDKPAFLKLRPLAVGLSLALAAFGVTAAEMEEHTGPTEPKAEPVEEPRGALGALKIDPNKSAIMKKLGLTIGGWAQAGITYNSQSPDNNFNGPVTFGDRSGEFQLNQAYLFLQKPVATSGDSWDVGGRFDFMYGTDSIFTQAYGVPALDVNNGRVLQRSAWDLFITSHDKRFYDIALPQAYLELNIPIGNGLNVKAGHFYTPIGYEVVTAPDNFFYSHAYTMQYGEPFTHTGFLGNYGIDKNWAVLGGVVTGSATGGWDGGWNQQLGNWNGVAGGTWTSDDAGTSFNVSGTYGATSEHSSETWGLYSLVLKHNWLDDLHMVVQHDHGYANGVLSPVGQTDAQWYGLNSYLMYDIMDNLGVGVRGEWFRDQAGFRVCSPIRVASATNFYNGDINAPYNWAGNPADVTCNPASWYAVTLGMNWKPVKWLNVRPNVRYDWVDGTNVTTGGSYRPFGNGKQDQFLFSTDVVITF